MVGPPRTHIDAIDYTRGGDSVPWVVRIRVEGKGNVVAREVSKRFFATDYGYRRSERKIVCNARARLGDREAQQQKLAALAFLGHIEVAVTVNVQQRGVNEHPR